MKPNNSKSKNTASVFVVTFNSADRIEDCIHSIQEQEMEDGSVEIIIVDNASADGTAELVAEKFPELNLIKNSDNKGFAAANNQAYAESIGETVFLVNPDSVLKPDSIQKTIDYFDANFDCGIIGGLLLDDDGHRAPSARRFPTFFRKVLMLSGVAARNAQSKILGGADYDWHDHRKPLDVDWVPGAFTGLRRAVVEEVGFFDERFYLYYEETDLCRRAKKSGWAIRFIPDAVVHHSGGASSRTVKHHAFDEAGSQVRPFRMRAECLYHRKNGGIMAMLSNVGFEYAWHHARRLVNLRPGKVAKAKRAYSKVVTSEIAEAVKATSFGSVCPPKPW